MRRAADDRERKLNEKRILDVARRLFTETGYDLSSMSRIAELSGVAPNTIYWYFADKDALLVAVLNEILAAALPEFAERRNAPLDEQLAWLVDTLEGAENLIATVHARASASDSVRNWHNNFHRMMEATLCAQLSAHGVRQSDLKHASQVAMFIIEGLLAHAQVSPDRRALMRWLVRSLDRATGLPATPAKKAKPRSRAPGAKATSLKA